MCSMKDDEFQIEMCEQHLPLQAMGNLNKGRASLGKEHTGEGYIFGLTGCAVSDAEPT